MKNSGSNTLKRLIPKKLRKKLYKLGKFLYQEEEFPSMEGSLNALATWGFTPNSAIDIGAYAGKWTVMFKTFFPDCKVLMIEAQEGMVKRLEEVQSRLDNVEIENKLLGPEDDREIEFIEMKTGSSVFEESSPYKRSRVLKKLVTLDTLIKKHPEYSKPDFLKLDVQGYELEILKGAEELLKNTEIILLEASLIPVNKGCPLISTVIEFMSSRNFRLLDFCSQVRRKDSSLWQTDLLFINEQSTYLPSEILDDSNWRRNKTASGNNPT